MCKFKRRGRAMFLGLGPSNRPQLRQERHVCLVTLLTELILQEEFML